MDNSFSSLIDTSSSILVLLPTKPYFDQVAAGLSLYISLATKKQTEISCPSPMMVGFNRIIGIDKISSEVGNKNLIIKFAGYDANNIEKVSYDIENNEFKLTVIPKIGFSSPQKEQLNLNYAGVLADLVILIGGANDSHFPILSSPELSNSKIVHIGNRNFYSDRQVMSFAKPGSSTSELVANIIKENNFEIDPDIATNLVMGIEDGSSNFAGTEVTPDTFETFAWLLRNGGQRQSRVKLSPVGFPPGAIPTMPFGQSANEQIGRSAISKSANDDQPVSDTEGTQEIEQNINPPDDWLQPKVFKNSNPSSQQVSPPDSFSENKG